SYAFSATMLLTGLRREKAPPEKDYVAFAPVFPEGLPAAGYLPASRREVTDVLKLFRERYGLLVGRLHPSDREEPDHLPHLGAGRYPGPWE
ncbi:MAG: hypothetical protein Q8938_16655, partial [Bacteroidota bacterium]|nr:hypothetical protein [Bacteroidota bacterium]